MRLTTPYAIAALAAAAIAAPASAAPPAAFLELGAPVGGAAHRGHQGYIELESYAFDAARKGWDGTVKGGSVTTERKGWDGSVKGNTVAQDSAAAAKFGAVAGAHRDSGVADPAAEAADAAKTKPKKTAQYDLKTSNVARTAPAPAPSAPGSVTVDGSFAACTVGAAYAGAVLQLAGVRYELTDVQITSCPAPTPTGAPTLGGERSPDSLSLNYAKVKVRGWDPEKKEE